MNDTNSKGLAPKGLNRGDNMVDARGVKIAPGDVVIYGFGVGRSVAMAEGRIRDDGYGHVSTTPSGRVWVTIVRRSYGGGEEERVHVAPDRLVVLKPSFGAFGSRERSFLPPSPLPTQDEANLTQVNEMITRTHAGIAALEAGGPPPGWARSSLYRDHAEWTDDQLREWVLGKQRTWLAEYEDRLAMIQARIEKQR